MKNKKILKEGTDVTFDITINGEKKTKYGSVYIIDKHGTFEKPGNVSYDVMCFDENMLYKHLGSDVTPIKHKKGLKNKWNNIYIRKPKNNEPIIVLFRIINLEGYKYNVSVDVKYVVYDKNNGFDKMEERTENKSITPIAWLPFPEYSIEVNLK